MERKDYLQACQRFAIGEKKKVVFRGSKYFPVLYELSFDVYGNPVHSAVLRDIKANSIIHCKLEEVLESEN